MRSGWFLFRVLFLSEIPLLGSALLTISLSMTLIFSSYCIFSGLHEEFFRKIELTRTHLTITSRSPYFEDPKPLNQALEKMEGVRFWPSLLSQGLVRAKEQGLGVFLVGLEPAVLCKQIRIPDCEFQTNDVFISRSLAADLGVLKGEEGTLVVADGTHHRVRFQGYFEDFGWSDQRFSIFMDLKIAQNWIYGEDLINRIEIRTKNPHSLDSILTSLQNFETEVRLVTWKDLFSETLRLFDVEKSLHYFFFGLLTMLIGIATYLTFVLFFLRKAPSFESLRRLGYAQRKLRLFLAGSVQTVLILALGFGSLLCRGIKWLLDLYPIELPQSLFYSPILPFQWDWPCFLMLCILFFLAANFGCFHARRKASNP
ncbi:hypothetical protein HOF92_07300 [bacterium]|mgnify:FL=1|jgi:ABC-type lipoprotein release transport system permease subunit|nr:hypothetical protein [bacterium]